MKKTIQAWGVMLHGSGGHTCWAWNSETYFTAFTNYAFFKTRKLARETADRFNSHAPLLKARVVRVTLPAPEVK